MFIVMIDIMIESSKVDNSVLEKIVLMDPNIVVIELKDGNKISCLFEITKGA